MLTCHHSLLYDILLMQHITIARPHCNNKKVHTQFDQADLREESASKNLQSGLLPKRKMCEKMQRGRSSSIMIF